MTSNKIREKFINYFEKNGHTIVPSSSLLPADQSVLFTTAGMQQFKPYYIGEKSPYGNNVATCQKCVRTSDIEEVGDERHLTFFEMLGNFSFGGYQKEQAIKLAKEFLDSVNIKIDYVTVFGGDKNLPKDNDSVKIWEGFGFTEKRGNLKFCGKEDNFWGPTGEEGPCGPTTEIYAKNKEGKSIEIWNLVFNEFYCDKNKKLAKLEKAGVDTGMGLERLAVVYQNVSTVFETDLFLPIIKELESQTSKKYEENQQIFRIICDHVKTAVFLASEGITPSNVLQGYILRRLIRRAIRYGQLLKADKGFLIFLIPAVIGTYKDIYPELAKNQEKIIEIIKSEEEKFEKTIERGLKEFAFMVKNHKEKTFSGKAVFDLYQSYGFPIELTKELAKEKGFEVKEKEFQEELKKHQDVSRAGAEKKFGGVGKDANVEKTRLHTATHLLHQSLRNVLGASVRQMGSDITSERLRFDFSYDRKMIDSEIKEVENMVNEKIKEDLKVKKEEMPYEEAIKSNALAFFKEKYPQIVNVYSINGFSKEICAGPHVERTSELGCFKIIKEESSGAGIRRIKAILK